MQLKILRKKIFYLVSVLVYFFLTRNSYAALNTWHAVGTGTVGGAFFTNSARYQYFPINDPLEDEFYAYQASSFPSQIIAAGAIGVERIIFDKWLAQVNLSYAQPHAITVRGSFFQGADVSSQDQFTYQYNVDTRQIMAQLKLFYPFNTVFFPYINIGLGAALNTTSQYYTNVSDYLTVTRTYADKMKTTFTYQFGIGIEYKFHEHLRIGAGYFFANLGGYSFGSSMVNGSPVQGTLSQSNLYANEIAGQLTFIL